MIYYILSVLVAALVLAQIERRTGNPMENWDLQERFLWILVSLTWPFFVLGCLFFEFSSWVRDKGSLEFLFKERKF